MNQNSSKKRILATLIICSGVIGSVWLYSSSPKNVALKGTNGLSGDFSVRPYIESNSNQSWKEMLNNTQKSDEKTIVLTENNKIPYDETTITSQISKDFMSEYLKLKSSGREVTSDDINNLTEKVLSVPTYTSTAAATYLEKNLKIINNPGKDAINNYKGTVTLLIKNSLGQIKEDPYVIIANSIKLNIPNEMNKLDPIIAVNKQIIDSLLQIDVPSEIVATHLLLLNALSRTLADLESIRVTFDDPVKSLSALKQYPQDVTALINSINGMGQYLLKK
ncbi:MAG: hypothetical protein ABL917_02310 [Parcubacteria group bacterium]